MRSWCINRRADGGLELPLKLVQARLGHASITMTADRYGHLFPRGDDGASWRQQSKPWSGSKPAGYSGCRWYGVLGNRSAHVQTGKQEYHAPSGNRDKNKVITD